MCVVGFLFVRSFVCKPVKFSNQAHAIQFSVDHTVV